MAQATLQEMSREVHLYSGEVCPILLCQRWVRDRYREICEKSIWSFKIGRGAFGTTDAYGDGTITLTNASATVTGSSTVWTSTHVGQQLKVNGFVFTITAVGGNTSLTIDQTWLGATSSSNTYTILQAYIIPTPTDFHAFYSVIDPTNAWRLRLGYNSKVLDRIDARRSSAGTPYLVANGVYTSTNLSTFELWPHPTTQKQYMYVYEKRVTDLVNASDTPPPIIRSDVVVKGALCDLARWPGTAERKNPMYDPPYYNQWKMRDLEYTKALDKLITEDQSIFLTDLTYGNDFGWAPLDAKFIQNHAF